MPCTLSRQGVDNATSKRAAQGPRGAGEVHHGAVRAQALDDG